MSQTYHLLLEIEPRENVIRRLWEALPIVDTSFCIVVPVELAKVALKRRCWVCVPEERVPDCALAKGAIVRSVDDNRWQCGHWRHVGVGTPVPIC